MSLLPVAEALARVLAGIERPVEVETVALRHCAGRTLAEDLAARRTQPPFAASAMDGYAVRAADAAEAPVTLGVIGRSVAGAGFSGRVEPGAAVRIFTGAPLPEGTDAIVLQEDADPAGSEVTLRTPAVAGKHIRLAGLDFRAGAILLRAGQRLDAGTVALAAAMGHPALPVRRRPRVAILATGDELAFPGEALGPDQIVASNAFALAAMIERAGGEPIDLGIARDTVPALHRAIDMAVAAEADLIVTLGGASVGEHDLVQQAFSERGLALDFWRVALRPGKPLMHGRLGLHGRPGAMQLLGLPGNPVSAIVCGVLFVVPAVRALQGDPAASADPSEPALLGPALKANDQRQDFLRATFRQTAGLPEAVPFDIQDSSMLSVLARSDCLLIREPHAPAAASGGPCRIIRLDRFL